MTKALEFIYNSDEKLKEYILNNDLSKLKINSEFTVFEDLVSCILDMQLRFRGNAVRYKRLKKLLNNQPITPDNIFSIRDEGIAEINMSRQKYQALENLTLFWEENELDKIKWQELEDEQIRQLLSQIKGIGNWTIDMILLFTLQRQDVFPIDDFHLKKAMANLYELNLENKKNLKKEMVLISQNWKPYRSTAVLYLLDK